MEVEDGIGEINGNGRNTIKSQLLKDRSQIGNI